MTTKHIDIGGTFPNAHVTMHTPCPPKQQQIQALAARLGQIHFTLLAYMLLTFIAGAEGPSDDALGTLSK